ncbi:hypothetical protein PMAYCL1PPCAC_05397, partial [Pristionchus mayeri]
LPVTISVFAMERAKGSWPSSMSALVVVVKEKVRASTATFLTNARSSVFLPGNCIPSGYLILITLRI